MPPPFENKGKQAAWNAGQLTSFRLNELTRFANFYSSQGALRDWHATLDALYREASTKMTKEEAKAGKDMRSKVGRAASGYYNSRQAGHKNSSLMSGRYHNMLDTYEIWIRGVLDAHNLMMPDADDPGLAMEDM